MAAVTIPNFEEAATVASDFITSLDNLPNEVQHLLQEIKIKEQKCQDLLQEAASQQSKYIKSTLKPSAPPSISAGSSGNKSATGSPTPNSSTNPKAHYPARIAEAYAEIDALNQEKIALARRLVDLLTFTRARLDADLTKVRTLQGEAPEDIRASSVSLTNQLPLALPYIPKRLDGHLPVIDTAVQLNESLRSATHALHDNTVLALSPAPGPEYNKKRRLTTNTSIKLPSPAPAAVARQTGSNSRSRLSRHSHTARMQEDDEDDLDADAEGEEDFEDAEEDLTPWCFCHEKSYGDMIGCDNPDCPYQWFHIVCVGVKTPLPDKWYCPECIKTKSVAGEKRKGRKK